MKAPNIRIIVYTADVQRITGKSERNARLLLQKIKAHYAKKQHQLVSIYEFAAYLDLPEDIVSKYFED